MATDVTGSIPPPKTRRKRKNSVTALLGLRAFRNARKQSSKSARRRGSSHPNDAQFQHLRHFVSATILLASRARGHQFVTTGHGAWPSLCSLAAGGTGGYRKAGRPPPADPHQSWAGGRVGEGVRITER